MDQFLQDNKSDTTSQTIPMGGCTSHRMKDLTQRTLLRLCGEKQGDYHIAWRRLSTGWGLVSSLDMEAKGIYEKIREQLKWIKNVLCALQENKNLTSKMEEIVQKCLCKTMSANSIIMHLHDTYVSKGQKPVYLWDVIPFECDETMAKAVLSHLFPYEKELHLDVDEFIKGYQEMEEQCEKETAGTENVEHARQMWWKYHNELVTSTSYNVWNIPDDKVTIDLTAFPSKSMAVRSAIEFIVDVPSFCDETLKAEMGDILKRIEMICSTIRKMVEMDEKVEQQDDKLMNCLDDLMGSIHRFYQRKGIEDNFGCDPEEADASTADKAEKDQQPEEPADDSLSPMMEDDEISENDELPETDGEPGDAEKETSDEDFMGVDREVADDVTDEIGYKSFLADARSFSDHCSSFKERIANALRKTGLKLFSEMESYQIKIQWDGWTSKPEDIVIRIMLFNDAATDEELDAIKNLLHAKDMVIETNEDYALEVCCMYNDNPLKY